MCSTVTEIRETQEGRKSREEDQKKGREKSKRERTKVRESEREREKEKLKKISSTAWLTRENGRPHLAGAALTMPVLLCFILRAPCEADMSMRHATMMCSWTRI